MMAWIGNGIAIGSRLGIAVAAMVAWLAGLPAAGLAGPALLIDASNGKVLYAEDPDQQWYPASLTKIMTAYLAFDAIKTGKLTHESKITVSEKANLQPPSKVGLPVGAEMTMDVALKALIVKSANDVAVMVAEAIAGSEEAFVERMNATARRLGMTRTHFVNANGLPAAEQVTTARDLARLALVVVREYPEYAPLWGMVDMNIGKLRLHSHNGLLKTYEGADGLKTGFTCDSGYNVVASANRDGRRLMAVVLGEPSGQDRSIRAASLLEHGFQFQGWQALFNQTTLDTLPMTPDAKPAASVRTTVFAFECGNRRRPPIRAKARGNAKVVAAKPAAAKAGPQTASNQPAAAPAPAAKPKKATVAASPAATQPAQAAAQAPQQ